MGSFSFTCAVSGLPIEAGDEVRFLLLTENPYRDNLKCQIHSMWFPRVWPIRGRYNDYGSVEQVEEGPARSLFLDLFQVDLVEIGWGSNLCHDVEVVKSMSWANLLTACWEGRIRVRRSDRRPEETRKLMKELLPKIPLPEGIPTRRRIERVLLDAGFDKHTEYGKREKKAVVVSREGYGRIFVRSPRYGAGGVKTLTKAEKVIRSAGYATMLTAGRTSSAAELLVRPLPSVQGYHYHRNGDTRSVSVQQAMIREDVWQGMLGTTPLSSWSEKVYDIGAYREGANTAWGDVASLGKGSKFSRFIDHGTHELGGRFLQNPLPSTVGLGSAFKAMIDKSFQGEVSEEQKDRFLQSAAEFSFIQGFLERVRYQWRPSYSNGPQFGDWAAHEQMAGLVAKIATAERTANELEQAKWDKEAEAEDAELDIKDGEADSE